MIDIKDIPNVLEMINKVQLVCNIHNCISNYKFIITKTKFMYNDKCNVSVTIVDHSYSLALTNYPLSIRYDRYREHIEVFDYTTNDTPIYFQLSDTDLDNDMLFQYSTKYENIQELIVLTRVIKEYNMFVSIQVLLELDLDEVLKFLKEAYATLTQSSTHV